MIYNKNKNSLETAFLGKKIPWSVVQPKCGQFFQRPENIPKK
jgi:hypothetical protein